MVVLFLPLELAYVGSVYALRAGDALSPDSVPAAVQRLHNFDIFMEPAWISLTYIAVVAVCAWQQRLLALRSQLEPHFLFNALNAISALVRSDDNRVALTGISRLSDLLRYGAALRGYVQASVQTPLPAYWRQLSVRSGGRIECVQLEDVLWMEAAGNYVEQVARLEANGDGSYQAGAKARLTAPDRPQAV